MKRLWILADDLTGAIDTGIKFADRGILTCVLPFGVPDTSGKREDFQEQDASREQATSRNRQNYASLTDAPVMVINTMSRHDTPQTAKTKIQRILCQAKKANVDYLYKKTDATLRGNIGAELGEMAVHSETRTVVFLPSFPEMGRTVLDGVCYVDGIPLKDTPMARDPFTPVKHSRIRRVIAEQTDIPVIENKKNYTLPETFSSPCICVFDGETKEDLDLAARALRDCSKIRYTAGCSAFAQSLIPYLGLTGQIKKKTGGCKGAPILTVCGSINETTLQQTRYAGDVLGYQVVTLTPEQKLISGYSEKGTAFFLEMATLLKRTKKLLIRAVSDCSDMEETARLCRKLSINPETAHLHIADQIGRLTAQLLQNNPASVAILFGGDTLAGAIRHLGTEQIRLLGEIAPGVVDTLLFAGKNQYRVITKSGALGGREIMRVIEDYLSQ